MLYEKKIIVSQVKGISKKILHSSCHCTFQKLLSQACIPSCFLRTHRESALAVKTISQLRSLTVMLKIILWLPLWKMTGWDSLTREFWLSITPKHCLIFHLDLFSNQFKILAHHAVLLFWFASLIESETDSNFLLRSNQNSITPHWSAQGFHSSSWQWNLEWMSGHDQIKWAHQLVTLDSEESLSLLRMGQTFLKILLLALYGTNLHQHHWILFGSKTLLEQLLCGSVITFL